MGHLHGVGSPSRPGRQVEESQQPQDSGQVVEVVPERDHVVWSAMGRGGHFGEVVAALASVEVRFGTAVIVERGGQVDVPVVVDRHVSQVDAIAESALYLVQQQGTGLAEVGEFEHGTSLRHTHHLS